MLPAVLYYLSAYFMVDLQARKAGLVGLSKEELPDLRDSLHLMHMLLPVVYLVYAILTGASLMMAALQSIGLIIVISFLRRQDLVYPA